MSGRGPRGNSASCSALCQLAVTFPATHKQSGPFWCRFLGRGVCVCYRTLWVSPTNSPVRLGVSPAAASTPTGVFSQRFEALFPLFWSPGLGGVSCSPVVPPGLSTWNMGPPGLPAATLPHIFSAGLSISAPPTGLGEYFFFNSLIFGLPNSLISWQFWLVFVFKFVVLFLVVRGGTV